MAITGIQDRTDLSRRESFASAPNGRADVDVDSTVALAAVAVARAGAARVVDFGVQHLCVAARGDDDEDDVFVYDQAGDFDLHPRAQ